MFVSEDPPRVTATLIGFSSYNKYTNTIKGIPINALRAGAVNFSITNKRLTTTKVKTSRPSLLILSL